MLKNEEKETKKMDNLLEKIGNETVGSITHNEDFSNLYDYYFSRDNIDMFNVAMDFYLLGRISEREGESK